jgi:hypothetical protein
MECITQNVFEPEKIFRTEPIGALTSLNPILRMYVKIVLFFTPQAPF